MQSVLLPRHGAKVRVRAWPLLAIVGLALACSGDPTRSARPLPVLASVEPGILPVGYPSASLTLTGANFDAVSVVRINGVDRPTTWRGSSSLTAALTAADVAAPGTLRVTVHTPPPGGGTTAALEVTVASPAPVLLALDPAELEAGSGAATLTLFGEHFLPDAKVRWAGAERPTTWVSELQLRVSLPASDLATAGRYEVSVRQSAWPAAAREIVVWNATPAISSHEPMHVFAGAPAQTVAVTGTNFVQGAVVLWNGAARPTTWISSTRLQAAISAADLAAAGTGALSVDNPAPARSRSNAVGLPVHDPNRYVLPYRTGGLAWDPVRQRLYASVTETDPVYPNRVIALDPLTGEVTRSVAVAREPARLAISDDASTLYVAQDSSASVRRIDLASFTAGTVIRPQADDGEKLWANDIEVMPGAPGTVALTHKVRRCNQWGCWFDLDFTVALYDGGVRRGPMVYGGSALAFAGRDTLWGFNGVGSGHQLYRMLPTGSGPAVSAILFDLVYGFYADIVHSRGLLFSSSGPVVDAARGVRVAELPDGGTVAADPATGRVFFMWGNTLAAYEGATQRLIGREEIQGVPALDQPVSFRPALVRWGTDGFAYRTPAGLVLFRSRLAVP